KQLDGLKAGETRSVIVKAPDTHQNEEIRGKDVEVEFKLKEIKRMDLPEVDEDFLKDLGFEKLEEPHAALKEQMTENIDFRVQQSMREQVSTFLLENVKIDLPSKLSEKQA